MVSINYHTTLILKLDFTTVKNFRHLALSSWKKISIAIDAMGGDNSPHKTLEGVKIFLQQNNSKMIFCLIFLAKKKRLKI